MKWLISGAIVLLIIVTLSPRAEISPERAAAAKQNAAPTLTPYPSPPLVFVPLEKLNPFPTLGAHHTTRTPNKTSLRAHAHFPKPNAHSVSPDSLISIRFDTRMERASVEARFNVFRADTGAEVDGYFEWTNRMMVFYPVPLLESNVEYRVVLDGGARTLQTNTALQEKVEWNFWTGELSPPQS